MKKIHTRYAGIAMICLSVMTGCSKKGNADADKDKDKAPSDYQQEMRTFIQDISAYAKQQKMSEWLKAQPDYLGAQGKTVFDPDFDIDDGGMPQQKIVLPKM